MRAAASKALTSLARMRAASDTSGGDDHDAVSECRADDPDFKAPRFRDRKRHKGQAEEGHGCGALPTTPRCSPSVGSEPESDPESVEGERTVHRRLQGTRGASDPAFSDSESSESEPTLGARRGCGLHVPSRLARRRVVRVPPSRESCRAGPSIHSGDPSPVRTTPPPVRSSGSDDDFVLSESSSDEADVVGRSARRRSVSAPTRRRARAGRPRRPLGESRQAPRAAVTPSGRAVPSRSMVTPSRSSKVNFVRGQRVDFGLPEECPWCHARVWRAERRSGNWICCRNGTHVLPASLFPPVEPSLRALYTERKFSFNSRSLNHHLAFTSMGTTPSTNPTSAQRGLGMNFRLPFPSCGRLQGKTYHVMSSTTQTARGFGANLYFVQVRRLSLSP